MILKCCFICYGSTSYAWILMKNLKVNSNYNITPFGCLFANFIQEHLFCFVFFVHVDGKTIAQDVRALEVPAKSLSASLRKLVFTMAGIFRLGRASSRSECRTPSSCPSCRSPSSSSWSLPRMSPSLHWTVGSSSRQDICWRTPGHWQTCIFWFVVIIPKVTIINLW